MVDGPTVQYVAETKPEPYAEYEYIAAFTDEKDIAELLELMDFNTPNNRSIFRGKYSNVDIRLEMKNGETHYVHLKEGILPEKFLEYFARVSYGE